MRFSFVADHFQYAACIPLLALAAASLSRVRHGVFVLTAWCLVLAQLTSLRLEAFQNPESLWRDTLRKNPDCVVAHLNLANDLSNRGLFPETEAHLYAAERLEPENLNVQLALARFDLNLRHRPEEAEKHFRHAQRIVQAMPPGHVPDGNNFLIHYYLGQTFAAEGRKADAQAEYNAALRAMAPLEVRCFFDLPLETLAIFREEIMKRFCDEGLTSGQILF